MTFGQSIALTAAGIVIFTLAVAVIAVHVYSRPYVARRDGRARAGGSAPPPAGPIATQSRPAPKQSPDARRPRGAHSGRHAAA